MSILRSDCPALEEIVGRGRMWGGEGEEVPSHPFFLQGEVWVGAETQEDCTAWVKALQDAGRV